MRGEEHCGFCGRSILAGERVRGYVSADGRRAVCELCVEGAERLGWRPEGEPRPDQPSATPGRRRSGLGALFRRRPRPETPEPLPEDEADDPDRGRAQVSSHDPAAAGKRSGAPDLEPSPLSPFERAAARFNLSEAGRTVAGLSRTLGAPSVSVGASAGTPSEVRITVAWELSWYQWGVDLSDETRPVFQLDKGLEISQLDAAARQWNASTIEGGRIVLAAPAQGQAPGQPARR